MLLFILAVCVSAGRAQTGAASADSSAAAESSSAQSAGADFELRSGMNEFGFWGGFAPAATHSFGGLHEDETRDRKLTLLAFRYGRVFAASKSIAWEYTLDAIPVALASGNIISAIRATPDGAIISARRETTYGAGVSPLGLQLHFSNRSKVKPFVHINAGLLVFNKSVPLPDAGRLSFTLEGGGGVRVFTSERHAVSLGVRLHHISNGDRSGSNRGLNEFVIYAGFSVFR